ncbi:MAG: hypothetical protein HY754_08530 [Nitrospirae bacterium]|nr:hypothetical protein [Nitrospirota bacterium]
MSTLQIHSSYYFKFKVVSLFIIVAMFGSTLGCATSHPIKLDNALLSTEEGKLKFINENIKGSEVSPEELQGKKIAIISFWGISSTGLYPQLDEFKKVLDRMAFSLKEHFENIAGVEVMSFEDVVKNKAYQELKWKEISEYKKLNDIITFKEATAIAARNLFIPISAFIAGQGRVPVVTAHRFKLISDRFRISDSLKPYRGVPQLANELGVDYVIISETDFALNAPTPIQVGQIVDKYVSTEAIFVPHIIMFSAKDKEPRITWEAKIEKKIHHSSRKGNRSLYEER